MWPKSMVKSRANGVFWHLNNWQMATLGTPVGQSFQAFFMLNAFLSQALGLLEMKWVSMTVMTVACKLQSLT